jgi:leucyl aminopeptidase
MTCFTTTAAEATPIDICRPEGWAKINDGLTDMQQRFAKARKFDGGKGQRLRLPAADGSIECVLYGVGPADDDVLGPIRMGGLSSFLSGSNPESPYKIRILPVDWSNRQAAIGWGLGAYKFDRYLPEKHVPPVLVLDDAETADEIIAIVEGTTLGRDLINTPAGDMGPEALHQAATDLAAKYDANLRDTVGPELLAKNYPMIHAVGRAAHEAPRLVEIEWGDPSHPRLAVVGKGITFDTGGVNIKSASGARIMKKDMGGAAHALALSSMIMATGLPVRLHCLIAVAENAISANAYRPGDILNSREGLTVEIDNTDAEGRLVLGDALCRAAEDEPVLIIDFATLTGAARVALGPTLPPFFSNREGPVQTLLDATVKEHDPVWRMPLWQPYNSMLNSPIADMKNAGGSFAGSVTAALFLERFVKRRPWMHLDVYGWNPSSSAAHPAGGDMFALRGIYRWLKAGGLNGDFSS